MVDMFLLTEKLMKETLKMMFSVDMVFTILQKVMFMKVNMLVILCMVGENILLLMVVFMKENLKLVDLMVKVLIPILMVVNMKVTFNKINDMVKVCSLMLKVTNLMKNGRKENVLNMNQLQVKNNVKLITNKISILY